MRYRRNTEETNFWAGYADCMLALFMIALLLWLLSAGVTAFSSNPDDDPRTPAELAEEIHRLEDEVASLKTEVASLKLQQEKDQIKIIELKEELTKCLVKIAKLEKQLATITGGKEDLKEVATDLENLKDSVDKLLDLVNKKTVEELIAEVERLKDLVSKKPPIINLTEGVTKEFRFPSGLAVIPDDFLKKLKKETFKDLSEILVEFPNIDTLEIVGHTDGSPINRLGNTDKKIPEILQGSADGYSLQPGSNADLGLMRALSIRNEWLKWIASQGATDQNQLSKIDVRCYSAAQTVPPGAKPTTKKEWLADNAKARRIEIRFTQLKTLK